MVFHSSCICFVVSPDMLYYAICSIVAVFTEQVQRMLAGMMAENDSNALIQAALLSDGYNQALVNSICKIICSAHL